MKDLIIINPVLKQMTGIYYKNLIRGMLIKGDMLKIERGMMNPDDMISGMKYESCCLN